MSKERGECNLTTCTATATWELSCSGSPLEPSFTCNAHLDVLLGCNCDTGEPCSTFRVTAL